MAKSTPRRSTCTSACSTGVKRRARTAAKLPKRLFSAWKSGKKTVTAIAQEMGVSRATAGKMLRAEDSRSATTASSCASGYIL